MRARTWSTHRVALACGVQDVTLRRLMRVGFVKPVQVGAIRVWTLEDVQAACLYLGLPWDDVKHHFPGLVHKADFQVSPSATFRLEEVAEIVAQTSRQDRETSAIDVSLNKG